MHDIPALERVGLAKNDRLVYVSLLELGSATASALVKRTGLHRSYVYDILDKLIRCGLAGFIVKNNKKYFEASNPEKIMGILESREQKIKEDKESLKKVLSELGKRKEIAIGRQEGKIFTGKEGIKSILEDILRENRNFVAFGAEGKFKENFKWYFDNWQKRRNRLGLKYKIIYNSRLREKRPAKGQRAVETRFLPKKYEFPATTMIYGNKVVIIIWNDAPIGFILESEKATKSFMNYFELLWNIGKK